MAELLGWMKTYVPEVLRESWRVRSENLGRVPLHGVSRSSSQRHDAISALSPMSLDREVVTYSHRQANEASGRNKWLSSWHRYCRGGRIRPPVCFRMRRHNKVIWLCSHPILRWLVYAITPVLLITSPSGWGRSTICTSAFYTAAGAKQLMLFCIMRQKFQKQNKTVNLTASCVA